MSKEMHIFKTVVEAKKVLSAFNAEFKYPKDSDKENKDIIKKSVSSNIFRAFRDIPQPLACKDLAKPSEIYRTWANNNFDEIISRISKITNIYEYDNFIFELNDSLLNHWLNKLESSKYKLGFGPSIKMINLLIKTILQEKKYHKPKLVPFLHVPFDKYSLMPLMNIINELTDINYKINIPKTATMQFVNTKELYVILLKAIRILLSDLPEIYPIIYDYWSWDDKH